MKNCITNNTVIGGVGKKQRESGIELLRILSACMVIWLHTNIPWGLQLATDGINNILLHVFEAIAVPAVDIFILISGYFMVNKNSVSIGKPASLLLQYYIFGIAFFIPIYIYRYPNLPFDFSIFLLKHWFLTLYITMYFLSPYLNRIIKGLNLRQCGILLTLSVFFLSVYPIACDYIHLYTSFDTSGMNTVSRWNDDMGNNVITFLLLYLTGGLINKMGLVEKIARKKAMTMWCVSTLLIFCLYDIDMSYTDDVYGSVTLYYHNPLVIIQAVSLFVLFKNFTFKSNIINSLAAAAFTCYLLQGKILRFFHIDSCLTGSSVKMLIYYVLLPIVIYLISYFVYVLYSTIFKKLIGHLDKKVIQYYD